MLNPMSGGRIGMGLRVGAVAAMAPSLAACGGLTNGVGSDGGPKSDGSGSSSDTSEPPSDAGQDDTAATWSPVCPDTPPTLGASCTAANVSCEYACNSYVFSCSSQGVWSAGANIPCDPSASTNPAACPSGAIQPQASCYQDHLACVVPDEGECVCIPTPEPDGGTYWWSCNPQPGCPYPHPRIGSVCTEGMYCAYPAGEAVICTNGLWTLGNGGF
jgi:hypothetical protein